MSALLEICVDNLESARNAEAGGADRIELCSAYEVGGLTPSKGLMRKAKEILDIPVFTLIRPRSGYFTYNELEISQMIEDIRDASDVGVDGFVFGALKDYKVDKDVCSQLLKECGNSPVTFHRAFDLIRNSYEAIQDLHNLNFTRLLTSGRERTAYEGRARIESLMDFIRTKLDQTKLIIMPGCGINEDNIAEIMHRTGAKEFHSSAQFPNIKKEDDDEFVEIVKGTSFYPITSADIVRNMKNILLG